MHKMLSPLFAVSVLAIAAAAPGQSRAATLTPLVCFNGTNGADPEAGLIMDASGNLFGTTYYGGANGDGTVFEVVKTAGVYASTPTTLVSFDGTNGAHSLAGLIMDANGNLFGTTLQGGTNNSGTVFEIVKTAGVYASTPTTLASFNGTNDNEPEAGLIMDANANLFGTTESGGANGYGTVFDVTGSGFATATPFHAFNTALQIDFGKKPNTDAFALEATFTLASNAPPINPLTQPVTISVDTFTTTIPADSFQQIGGAFTFAGVIQGVSLQAGIAPTGTLRYAFGAAAENASLTGTANPVPVTLTIGNDTGTASVNALVVGPLATTH